jgi:filamentous hemagglutinin
MVSGIAAAVAGQGAQGVAIAASTGANAAENNWLNHADAEQLKRLKQKQQAGQCDTACENSIAGLELLDKLNNRLLLNACVNGTTAECQAQIERDPAALKYGVDNAVKIAVGRTIAQAGTNANKALASLSQALAKTELKPLVDAKGFITGWAVDLGGADPDTLRYWAGAGVYVGAGTILPTSAIELIPGAGKGLKVVTRGAERVVVEEASGKVLGKIGDAGQVKQVAVGSKSNWDKAINGKMEPNTAYVLDNKHVYVTDTSGRVTRVEGSLDLAAMDRNGYQQLCAGKSGCAGDDGGHLIASSLGGAGDRINIVPQASTLNRGDWKAMENYFRDELAAGKAVSVKIEVGYPAGGGVRPSGFTVVADIGGKPYKRTFKQ